MKVNGAVRLLSLIAVVAAGIAIARSAVSGYARYRMSDCSLASTFGADLGGKILATQAEVAQSSKRLATDGPLELWDTPLGRFWRLAETDPRQFTRVIAEEANGIYEPSALIRPGDVVLDIGAGIGTFTRSALRHGAAVVAVEPHPLKCEAMRRTFSAEVASGKLSVVPKGVWDHEAVMRLDGITVSEQNGIEVPLTTIDALVSELHLPRVDLIKMDIEGAEKRAIRGAQGTIRRFRPTWSIATEHLEDDPVAIPALLQTFAPYRKSGEFCIAHFSDRLQPFTISLTAR